MAYIANGQSVAIRTTPGRQVHFRGGVAQVRELKDLPTLMAREDMTIEVSEDWSSFMPGLYKEIPGHIKLKARITYLGDLGEQIVETYDLPEEDVEEPDDEPQPVVSGYAAQPLLKRLRGRPRKIQSESWATDAIVDSEVDKIFS